MMIEFNKPREMNREVLDDLFHIVVLTPIDNVPWPTGTSYTDKVQILNTLNEYYREIEAYEKCKLIAERKREIK